MAGLWRAACLVLFALGILGTAVGQDSKTYQVGAKNGENGTWVIPATVNGLNYQTWANSIKFKFGDELVFNYPNNSHNVLLVNASSYKACILGDPILSWSSGEDVVELTQPNMAEYCFICGFPGHCAAMQKFQIAVSAFTPSSTPVVASPPPPPPNGSPRGYTVPSGVLIRSLAAALLAALV